MIRALPMLIAALALLVPHPGAVTSAEQPAPDPVALFEYGEELAATARTEEGVRLARTTLTHAAQLAGDTDPDTAAGACLALAQIAQNHEQRRWLTALAIGLRPELARGMRTALQGAAPDDLARRAAALLLASRSAMPTLSAWRDDDMRGRVRAIAGQQAVDAWREDARRWPCPTCRNRRFVASSERDSSAPRRCPFCMADPGPPRDGGSFLARVLTEGALLGVSPTGWSQSVMGPGGRPLLPPSLDRLHLFVGVEPAPLPAASP